MEEYPPPQGQTGRGATILVLGILGLVLCSCFTGIPAWVMGNEALRDVERGIVARTEEPLIQVGRILGIISTALAVCAIVPYFVMAAVMSAQSQQRRTFADGVFKEAMTFSESHFKRQEIMDAVVAERKRAPQKDFRSLAAELTNARPKRVAWFDADLVATDGCGSYTFTAEKGTFTVADDCGSSSIYGWPPKQ